MANNDLSRLMVSSIGGVCDVELKVLADIHGTYTAVKGPFVSQQREFFSNYTIFNET